MTATSRKNSGKEVKGDIPCVKCGRPPTPEGYDACLGFLPAVESACCGHGEGEGYYIFKREVRGLKEIEELVAIQKINGNWDYSPYMRGLANGLILALAVLKNKEPKYLEEPKKYICP